MVTFGSRKAAASDALARADGERPRSLRDIARLSPAERVRLLRDAPASVDASETAAWDALAGDGIE